jgi:ABC-type antimicrobial peptide transport system permease subunit
LNGLVEGVGAMGAFYMPYAQAPSRTLTVALQTAVEPSALATPLRGTIARIDRQLAVFDVQSMAARTEQSLMPRRTPVLIASGFGIVALILAATGLYGVLAYLVAQRTKEIGIRIALGGTAGQVFALVLNEGLLVMTGGFVVGGIAAALLARPLQSQLFQVTPSNPVVLAVALAVLAVVTLAACLVPARRATRIDPVVALSE